VLLNPCNPCNPWFILRPQLNVEVDALRACVPPLSFREPFPSLCPRHVPDLPAYHRAPLFPGSARLLAAAEVLVGLASGPVLPVAERAGKPALAPGLCSDGRWQLEPEQPDGRPGPGQAWLSDDSLKLPAAQDAVRAALQLMTKLGERRA